MEIEEIEEDTEEETEEETEEDIENTMTEGPEETSETDQEVALIAKKKDISPEIVLKVQQM